MTEPTPVDSHLLPDTPDRSKKKSEASTNIDDLIEQMKLSLDKLQADHSSRGDVKILSRALRELRYAFKVFRPYRNRRKVAIFGSARTLPAAASFQQTVEFAKGMAEKEWMVVTGAASGIMEAGHVGAGRELSMGLNIMLPFEQSSNSVIAGDAKLVNMKYFFTRKLMFVKESHALCCLPGGFGTLDEGLEVLTLLQTGKRDMVPVVFLDAPGGTYWKDWDAFVRRHLLDGRMISPPDLSLYLVTDNVAQAQQEILQFYRVYHSMRYVHDKLVLRLEQPISDELLEGINQHFSDILASGQFRQTSSLTGERDEPELSHLSRLVFHFDRHGLGRLRQLINCLNSGKIDAKK